MAAAPVGILGTTRSDGTPHLVPVVFALTGERLVTAVDHKPKRSTALTRLENARHNPSVSIIVDHYDSDWSRLWWVRADGRAEVVTALDPVDLVALESKYPQYAGQPPTGPGLVLHLSSITGWQAADH